MEQMSLFSEEVNMGMPLASRLRPEKLDDYIGQEHLVARGKVLRRMLEKDMISSMIFWGPPGVGKTTLARIIANMTRASFIDFSAVTSGIREIKDVMKQAESGQLPDMSGSGAPLGSIGHFSETLGKCIDRYNSVFVG